MQYSYLYLGGAFGGQHRVGGRSRSPAVNRTSDQMNGGGGAVGPDGQYQYQQVPPRRQPRKVTYGTKNIGSTGAEAAPIEMFVGNTNPRATKEIVASVLKDCAKDMPEKPELEILDVRCLTNPERDPNPRTRCWKVTVPFKYKDFMENDEMYPSGWRYRKFFAARNIRKKPEGVVDSIENRVIQEQAKEREKEVQVLNKEQAKEPVQGVQLLGQEAVVMEETSQAAVGGGGAVTA